MNLTADQIRSKFLQFFESKGHKIIPSASLVPENDPSVLFNTAGMQPLVPYLLGQKHPMGTRLCDAQKCVRTGDIDEVGDNRHLTFFEMLGNWSLGDYFKEEAIAWSFEFLTNKETGLGLDASRIYVTVFEGDENAPRDNEVADIWKKYLPENRIYFLPAKNNWWSAGENGPCGPDTEIFYDTNENALSDMNHDEFVKADDEGRVIEIWNNVFMEYEKKDGKVIGKLAKHNVDTGMGLERIAMVCQGVKTVFDTDLFKDIIDYITKYSTSYDEHSIRIITDHIRTATFLLFDGVLPSNKGRGSVLRKLITQAIINSNQIGFEQCHLEQISRIFLEKYIDIYFKMSDIASWKSSVFSFLEKEEVRFEKILKKFDKWEWMGVEDEELQKNTNKTIAFSGHADRVLPGDVVFDIFQNDGVPFDVIKKRVEQMGLIINKEDFDRRLKEHQDLSRTASAGMFKGGLANHSEKTIRLHTAHHLLLAGLQEIVSKDIKQKGSNITEERLRMDFICDHKLTDEEKQKVEDWVNDKIKKGLKVARKELPLAEAEKIGAQMEFGAKYPEVVSVYFIEDEQGNAISKEFCGGPHVENTSELAANPDETPKHFKIQKEEASSAGVRRIKAVLE